MNDRKEYTDIDGRTFCVVGYRGPSGRGTRLSVYPARWTGLRNDAPLALGRWNVGNLTDWTDRWKIRLLEMVVYARVRLLS